MSHETEAEYRLRIEREREIREQLREQQRRENERRAREAISTNLRSFQNTLNLLKNQDLEKYAVKEFEYIQEQMSQIEAESGYDLFGAEQLSKQLAYQVNELPQLCKKRQVEEFERKRREKEAKEVISTHLKNFKDTLDSLKSQGLEKYATAEFEYIQKQMSQIEDMSKNDPLLAERLSVQLTNQVNKLPQLCKKRQVEKKRQEEIEKEAQRRAHLQALGVAWQEALQSWQNKSARNLALEELSDLHANIFENPQDYTLQDLKSQVLALEAKFVASIQEQQAKKQQELEQTYKQDLLKRYPQLPEHAKLLNLADLQKEVQAIEQAQAKRAEDEAVRKEMVKAVYASLKQAGFVVQEPSLDKEKDIVIVRANRPNGNQANFKISLDGVLNYRFDHYEGKTCKADMDKVLPQLSQVYGVDLSEERVIWENPDDLDKEARPLNPTQNQTRG
ncbi:hypothetical protein [Helicobacter suis]|uniref:hypothetical protein n=1 Tax=Helicobacter suis TaxID=104628 RepID=UPI0013D2A726|nr:hypothetical protein [Helicobacter suis]